tara:strand:+ start:40 stop:462 length:423 start_codon:yes stop_codon:yes gene_type:complete
MDVKAKIITQFVRDLSFENPNGPGAFHQGKERPTVKANVDVKATQRPETEIYEVELNLSVSGVRNEEQLYVVELKYVGLFEIENLTDDIKEAYLVVECPRQLFPFARRIIYDLHADGSLPPLILDPMNFAEIYKKRKESN